jgi:hypothetical protein
MKSKPGFHFDRLSFRALPRDAFYLVAERPTDEPSARLRCRLDQMSTGRREKSAVVSTPIQNLMSIQAGGDPGPIRTADLQFRKLLLYPSELRGHMKKEASQQVSITKVTPG